MNAPTLDRERELLATYRTIIALDEVGRGALAGPVAVGAAVCDASVVERPIPEGLRDSKLVTEKRRPDLAVRSAAWVCSSAVGWASAAEVDGIGIVRALGIAAVRAIEAVRAERGGLVAEETIVLLDGHHDYVSAVYRAEVGGHLRVLPIVKGDRDCASISAASVIAKVARDLHMAALHEDHPDYGWARNKGYASAAHRAAIREHGLAPLHRASWAIQDAPAALF